ncbi:MAG: hypothetical protein GX845_03205 [Erysipelothrix sp.]|jgi:hypothetical protein|nr:hypothetical protein [Erysipelothrix sp.]
MLRHLESNYIRKKYLLTEITDKKVANLIHDCITQPSKTKRLTAYEQLTHIVFDLTGGFDINAFKFKSSKDLSRAGD